MSGSDTVEARTVAKPKEGDLKPAEVDVVLQAVWKEELGSEVGRQEIAKALGVRPEDLRDGPSPIAIDEVASGFEPTTVIVVAHWTLMTIVVPVLIDLVKDEIKDEAKKRLARLWEDVLLPAIRRKKKHSAIGD
jgi:hypothetical protein